MNIYRPERMVWDLDWNLLRTFVVIAEVKSITRAADRLNLKQPSVSNALKRLEDRLGQRLILRDATHFELTPIGQLLYEQSIEVFGTISRLPTILRNAGSDVTGHLNIAMASHVVTPIFDETLTEFHATHPRATLNITIAASTEVIRQVREKRASFGLCLVGSKEPTLDYMMIYREFFGFYCGPRHHLFGKTGLTFDDLEGEPSVSFQTDHFADALRPVALLRSEARLNPQVVGTSSSLEEVRRMIIAGLGIGPLPVHVARRDVDAGLLWQLPPYDQLPPIEVYLVTADAKSLNNAEKAFLDLLMTKIEQTPILNRTYAQ